MPSCGSDSDRLCLTFEYLGNVFSGILLIDDTTVLSRLKNFPETHVGKELGVVVGLVVGSWAIDQSLIKTIGISADAMD